jgi:hypothetical protein
MNVTKIYINPPWLETGELGAPRKPVRKPVRKPTNSQTIYANQFVDPLATRVVQVQGTAKSSVNFIAQASGVDDNYLSDLLKLALVRQGWKINRFPFVQWNAGLQVYEINFAADVENRYSDAQTANSAANLINNLKLETTLHTFNLFNGVNIQVNSPTPKPQEPNTGGKSNLPKENSGGGNDKSNNGGAFDLDAYLKSLSPTNLLGTAGSSVILVTAVLIGIVILKR